jgi:hypothetical protein
MAGGRIGDPSLPSQTAADPRLGRQPGGQPLGRDTGAPSRTLLTQVRVTPMVNALGVAQQPTPIVLGTRENRFITLLAPFVNFRVYIAMSANVTPLSSLALPAGIPYEISLAGGQELYAATDAPVFLSVQIQVAPAIASDTERRL